MAGRGPAPRASTVRRPSRLPLRGDWIDLEPLAKPVLPALPRRSEKEGAWSARTRAAWKGMRADPATGTYGPPEIALAVELAYLIEDAVRAPKGSLLTEIRLRQDSLGLTPKGKRDLRWRLPDESSERPAPAPGATTRRRELQVLAVDPALDTTPLPVAPTRPK